MMAHRTAEQSIPGRSSYQRKRVSRLTGPRRNLDSRVRGNDTRGRAVLTETSVLFFARQCKRMIEIRPSTPRLHSNQFLYPLDNVRCGGHDLFGERIELFAACRIDIEPAFFRFGQKRGIVDGLVKGIADNL